MTLGRSELKTLMTMRNMRTVLSQRVARIVPITKRLYWSKNTELLCSDSSDVDCEKIAKH